MRLGGGVEGETGGGGQRVSLRGQRVRLGGAEGETVETLHEGKKG